MDDVNRVFVEHDIGFELTRYLVRERDQAHSSGSLVGFPRIVRRDQNLIQQEVLKPVLHLLTDQRLSVANAEMLKALTSLRVGAYEDAITAAGSAFESLMKTICAVRGWAHDTKDPCSRLVKVLKDNGLFPPLYAPVLEAVGTIRNNLGDAHGRGPHVRHVVTQQDRTRWRVCWMAVEQADVSLGRTTTTG